jgi:hypothetical protein
MRCGRRMDLATSLYRQTCRNLCGSFQRFRQKDGTRNPRPLNISVRSVLCCRSTARCAACVVAPDSEIQLIANSGQGGGRYCRSCQCGSNHDQSHSRNIILRRRLNLARRDGPWGSCFRQISQYREWVIGKLGYFDRVGSPWEGVPNGGTSRVRSSLEQGRAGFLDGEGALI